MGNVQRWGDGRMKKRWMAAGPLEAERSLRRVKGRPAMPVLVAALRQATGVTAAKYDEEAARGEWDHRRTSTTAGTSLGEAQRERLSKPREGSPLLGRARYRTSTCRLASAPLVATPLRLPPKAPLLSGGSSCEPVGARIGVVFARSNPGAMDSL